MSIFNSSNTPADRPIDTTRRSGFSKAFKQSVPGFILDEYPLFIEFLEAYYEWLDQKGNPVEFLQDGNRYFDIDSTSTQFLEHFKKNFLDGFPTDLTLHKGDSDHYLNERLLIKNIREIYKIKGSEKSIRLLFRIIADTEVTIEYPRDDIFALSSANYRDYRIVYVLKDTGNLLSGFDPSDANGLQIRQYQGIVDVIGSATIQSLHELAHNGKEYYVLTLSDVVGDFIQSDSQPLIISQNSKTFDFYPVPSVSDLQIVKGGTDYVVGDFFTVGNTLQEHIKGFISLTDEDGAITKVRLFSNPVNYSGSDSIAITTSLGTGAQFSITQSVLSLPISEYRDNKNLISSVSKIQDSFEYQQFSYRVKSKRPLESYLKAIKDIVHPSGFVILNSLYNNIYSIRPTEYKTRVVRYEYPFLGAYAAFKPSTIWYIGSPIGYSPPTTDGDPTKRFGFVYSRWLDETDPNNPFVNPSEGQRSVPSIFNGSIVGGISGAFLPLASGPLRSVIENQSAGSTIWVQFPHPNNAAFRDNSPVAPDTAMRSVKIGDMLRLPIPSIARS